MECLPAISGSGSFEKDREEMKMDELEVEPLNAEPYDEISNRQNSEFPMSPNAFYQLILNHLNLKSINVLPSNSYT